MRERPIDRLWSAGRIRLTVLPLGALAACVLCAPVSAAASAGSVAPRPNGKLISFGHGLSVRLEAGWKVRHVYPATGGRHGHGPYVWLTFGSPPTVDFYAFADGHTSWTPTQILARDFRQWSSGWLIGPRASKIRTFKIGPGEAFDSGAVMKIGGSESCMGAKCSSAGKTAMTGTALALKHTSSENAATIYAVGASSAYTASVQAQVEAMGDSIVSTSRSTGSGTIPTGSYTGSTSEGTKIRIAVHASTATVSFSDTAHCSNGSTTSGPATLRGLKVGPTGRFSGRPAFSNLKLSGSAERYSLRYGISGTIGDGSASGTLSAMTTFDSANGTELSTCSTGPVHWHAGEA